ncbi:hypothetical protein L1D24_17465 [Vibrio brasiliensis]|uniref:hypothetical protein n=1 Tax=Vibrio brasiliensis TaxID=170652 RepID=UPI001EFCA0BB|nr:hypothetical protein [Vibrio brasiliensis]MCG9650342.1 hypothetical protein [Vibrio brasiliensis]
MSVSAEKRLEEALNRLLIGKPERVKSTGKLTLNKINREAGLGHSYIHKFPVFVQKSTPLINEYNNAISSIVNSNRSSSTVEVSELERVKIELGREIKLKKKYFYENKDLKAKLKVIEAINNSLMYRIYELQRENGTAAIDLTKVNK